MLFFDAGHHGHAVLEVDFLDYNPDFSDRSFNQSQPDQGHHLVTQRIVYPGTTPPPPPN